MLFHGMPGQSFSASSPSLRAASLKIRSFRSTAAFVFFVRLEYGEIHTFDEPLD
jgi:hypothetical protein